MEQPINISPNALNKDTRPKVVMFAIMGGTFNEEGGMPTSGYLMNCSDPQQLMNAITLIGQGAAPELNANTRKVVLQLFPEVAEQPKENLSKRQKDVLGALVEGLSYKMIAAKLNISFETVRSHVKNIYTKLAVHNNTEAVAKALNLRLLA